MAAFKIALRSLLRRKLRMVMIGLLVLLGTVLIICGETFTLSAKHFSRDSIVNYFTGDLILYSGRSKEKPSPFSFTTPLPVLEQPGRIEDWLDSSPYVRNHVAIAQNFGLLSVEKKGGKYEVPFIFYAVDPVKYRRMFPNIEVKSGAFFNTEGGPDAAGVVLSGFQAHVYFTNYNVDIRPGDKVTLLSLTEGGSVNAYPSKIIGIYDPKYYKNVFNYINFLDIVSYSRLYNFTGVDSSSLPAGFNNALSASSDDDIFSLAGGDKMGKIDTKKLKSQELTGYTMIAVKLTDRGKTSVFLHSLEKQDFKVKSASWYEASSFFASVASIIQSVIYGATLLIFLIVVFILMNTLIISVLERTAEIGTLRAMGGEKEFITRIFLWESFLLNGFSALAGMLVSLAIILVVSSHGGIRLPDLISQYLVGGGVLKLRLVVRPFLEAFVMITGVSVLATLYPIRVATAITPLKAMNVK
jgi:putative ABC transport system permease protein